MNFDLDLTFKLQFIPCLILQIRLSTEEIFSYDFVDPIAEVITALENIGPMEMPWMPQASSYTVGFI